jgi:hypothetical protein
MTVTFELQGRDRTARDYFGYSSLPGGNPVGNIPEQITKHADMGSVSRDDLYTGGNWLVVWDDQTAVVGPGAFPTYVQGEGGEAVIDVLNFGYTANRSFRVERGPDGNVVWVDGREKFRDDEFTAFHVW